jgi:hypothetical protein
MIGIRREEESESNLVKDEDAPARGPTFAEFTFREPSGAQQ